LNVVLQSTLEMRAIQLPQNNAGDGDNMQLTDAES
jgi:hypothetical protein